jgi:formylglycine-generating enzyme required for sulfatase activity
MQPAAVSKASVQTNGAHQFNAKTTGTMKWIPAGTFWMGCDEPGFDDTRPWHRVHVDGFFMDQTLVTNEEFARFVKATGYVTVAEKAPLAKDFPGAPKENLVAGSLVFTPPSHAVPLNNSYAWWNYVHGANWRHPEGPNSNLEGRWQHPVVQVAWEDANAYAKWAGKRLPTEAEFEYAARGGLDRNLCSWGNQIRPGGKWQANTWQGKFPTNNTGEDGYKGTSPVGSYRANGYGLYDMTGNVWEWCSDWYRSDYYEQLVGKKSADQSAKDGDMVVNNPQGPTDSFDPVERGVKKRVQRGGSFLCTDQYCARYLVGARGKGEPSSGCCNVGFRCVKSAGALIHPQDG